MFIRVKPDGCASSREEKRQKAALKSAVGHSCTTQNQAANAERSVFAQGCVCVSEDEGE